MRIIRTRCYNNLIINTTNMSERSKMNRARREARQERQAKNVINGIIIGLILIALAFVVYAGMMS